MNSPFGSIPVPKKGSTLFDESHEIAGTFPLSQLCPVFFADTIPGDRWSVNAFNLTKLETLLSPSMQQVDASLLWFKVPKRLVFKHFKKWYSGGESGTDNSQKPHIYLDQLCLDLKSIFGTNSTTAADITNTLFGPGSLWNYLGLPVPVGLSNGVWHIIPYTSWAFDSNYPKDDSNYIDIMPLMAYHLIYDQYFRDQTLQDGCFFDSEEGILKVNNSFNLSFIDAGGNSHTLPPITGSDLSEGGEVSTRDLLRLLFCNRRAWRKDYFTSALPTPQRGPQVSLDAFANQKAPVIVKTANNANITGDNNVFITMDGSENEEYSEDNYLQLGSSEGIHQSLDLAADLSGLSPITIVAFRNLFRLQAFLEKNNVAGGRFIETILAHWGERVPDFTVQRAVHVRSTSIPVQISEVTATANSSGLNAVVGDQAGRAKAQGNLGKIHIYTHEPSFIFGLYCVTAPPVYIGQGIPRHFQHITRFDEPWRDFQHIGEQAIKNRELYFAFANGNGAQNLTYNKGDFGYQQRYSEYKYMPSRMVGDFCTSMAYWHMARMFERTPYLNGAFVSQTLDERIFAVQNARPVVSDFFFKATARRKLSKFSTPKLT